MSGRHRGSILALYLWQRHFPHSTDNNRYSCVRSLANQPVYASLSEDHGLFMRTGQNGENRNCGSNKWEGIFQTDVTVRRVPKKPQVSLWWMRCEGETQRGASLIFVHTNQLTSMKLFRMTWSLVSHLNICRIPVLWFGGWVQISSVWAAAGQLVCCRLQLLPGITCECNNTMRFQQGML